MLKLRRLRLVAVAAGLAALFLIVPGRRLDAQEAKDTTQGWTVWYGGEVTVYAAKDHWEGSLNPSGITFRNSDTGIERHYFGSFRAEMRPRDQG